MRGAEVFFASHNWPVWGAARIDDFITVQRDVMKYMHDRTVRMFNGGMNADEIADQIRLPAELDKFLHTHGYYGTVRHNVRGIFQFYVSGFDGNPARLDALPRAETARRVVDLRWAAQLLDIVLRVQPGHEAARALLVKTYRQIGFAAESAVWRNFYLMGAHELVAGPPGKAVSRHLMLDMLKYTATERFFEAMAASINGPKAEGLTLKINLVFSDTRENFVLSLDRSVMHHARVDRPAADANATLTLTKPFFLHMMTGSAGAKNLLTSSETRIGGSAVDLGRFLTLMEKAPGTFAIVPAAP